MDGGALVLGRESTSGVLSKAPANNVLMIYYYYILFMASLNIKEYYLNGTVILIDFYTKIVSHCCEVVRLWKMSKSMVLRKY